jgi:hypothetical protein
MNMLAKTLALLAGAAALASAAQAATVTAAYTGGIGSSITRSIVSGAGAPQLNTSIVVERFNMDQTAGSLRLVGGPGADFFAWCIEPREIINLNVQVVYNIVPLSQAATNIGGIGAAKANQVRELFGRFLPDFSASVTATEAAALQVALWEIVRETPGNPLDLATGNIYFTAASNAAVYNLAGSYLGAIDGTGPKAKRLLALNNGIFGVQGGGSQDLLVQAAVPEPGSWAMLIAGFGLVGAAARRRSRAVSA